MKKRFIAFLLSIAAGYGTWHFAKENGSDWINGQVKLDTPTLACAALALVLFAVAIGAFTTSDKKAKANA